MTCLTCDLLAARDKGNRPLWDNIHRIAYWDVVHFHIIPMMADMPAGERGPNVFKHLGVLEDQRVSETLMNEIGARVRFSLAEITQ